MNHHHLVVSPRGSPSFEGEHDCGKFKRVDIELNVGISVGAAVSSTGSFVFRAEYLA
jgi:hypothetical protein